MRVRLFQKHNIILGQERELVNHRTEPFTCPEDFPSKGSWSDLHQSSFRSAVKTRTMCRGIMVCKEKEEMDLDNTLKKCGCEMQDREIWGWASILECVCLLGVFRMGESEHLRG